MRGVAGVLKELYRRWRSKCPFVRKLEKWRMKQKAREFKVKP
ncbi:hypothetical protein [Thermococcus stetteri]|nr:hypothetical protein [Thermococcus stetteri]MBP1911844.1 hypothetical protein [Thermococcus stetteri]